MTVSSRTRLAIAAAVPILCQLFLMQIAAVESDEGMFAACAVRQIADHALPLVGCVDTKPPGIFILYEAAFRLFGNYNPIGLRLIWLCCALGLAAGVRAWRKGGPAGEDAAALCLLLLTTSNFFLALKTELPAIALVTGGIALAQYRTRGRLLLAGALFGLATAFKQPAALFILVGTLAARPAAWRDLRGWVRSMGWLGTGWALLLAMIVGVYWQFGALGVLVEQAWTRPALYALHKAEGYSVGLAAWHMIRGLTPLWCVVALLALSARQRRVEAGGPDWLAWGFLAVALLFISLGGHFFPSYCVVAIPAVALLLTQRPLPNSIGAAGGALAYSALFATVLTAGVTLAELSKVNRVDQALAREVNRIAAPGDRLYVWGYVPELYPESGRLPASRFVATTVLFGYFHDSGARLPRHAGMRFVLPGDWDAFLGELGRQPFLLLDTSAVRMGAPGNFSALGFPRMRTWMSRHCVNGTPIGNFLTYRCIPRTLSLRFQWLRPAQNALTRYPSDGAKQ